MPPSTNSAAKSTTRNLPFTGQRGFRKTLNERVNACLREAGATARDVPGMYVKTAASLAWWLVTYLLILLGGFPTVVNVALCIVWAFAIAGVGFNVMHDASHSAYSERPLVNKLMSFSGEMLGMSGFRWRTKHNVWHHTYTNIAGYDDDVETYGTLRLTPRAPWRPLYKLQAWYWPLVYAGIGFDFFARDFMMILFGKSDDNHVYPKLRAGDQIVFWVGKLFFVTIMFVLPMLVFPWWQVLVGFLIVMITVGVLMGVVFQLAHINDQASFPVPTGNPLRIENEWAIHQVETTVDFAPNNRLLSVYIGGLNYQVEHHLLPHICHLNYPLLAPVVRATCEEFGVPYHCYPTWREAFAAHLQALRLFGRATPG